ncbi:hypothetical protein BDP27DRAFT_1413435 [Rhodocollybia butyracea]|uniref:Uncharacterized protein n=1 Tax=Rhodocollybia butyracea TaxID=206335 RepID=A0A9P5QAK7_9AGAR|nr:hypothetical protein BDP27DRAFT_1413435 [Rhodocollybia butyracea]
MSAGLVTRVHQQELGKNAIPFLNLWITLHLISLILLPILVWTFLCSKLITRRRHPALINLCMIWILSGIFSLLLFFTGKAKPTDPEPGEGLCIAQAALLEGILPMWSVAVFILMYFILGIVSGDNHVLEVGKGKMLLMLGAPYIAQFCFSLAALVLSIQNPDQVSRERRFFYCSLHYPHLSDAMSIFTFIFCLGIIMLEIQLVLLLVRNYRGLRAGGQSTAFDMQLLVRAVVFGVFVFLGICADVVNMFSESSFPDMYTAAAGIIVFLVFGSQADVLRAWCFWKKEGPIHVSQSHEQGWANLDLTGNTMTTLQRDSFGPLRSPGPVQIADHVHGLHGRNNSASIPPI